MARRPLVVLATAGAASLALLAAAPAAGSIPAARPVRSVAVATTSDAGGSAPTAHVVTPDQARRAGRPRDVAVGASPERVARAFAHGQARALGLRGDLGTATSRRSPAGTTVVRLPQQFSGVPVMGGEVVVEVAADGSPRGAVSETLPDSVPDLTARVTAASAQHAAVASVAREAAVPSSLLRASAPQLSIFSPEILGAPGLPGSRLVWRTEVTSAQRRDVRHLVAIDAVRGVVALSIDENEGALARSVCDAAGTSADVPCTTPVRSEGDAATGNPDVDGAYDLTGATYDWYSSVLGRDSLDGSGLSLRSTTRWWDPVNGVACPMENAFWDGTQMVFGEGYAGADDVVAHELTHGVTQYTSNLYYFFESGAINESLSDFFGELVDLADGTGDDSPAVRWKLGEDLPVVGGADPVLRDMADPARYGQPDSTASALYSTGVSGGVVVDGGGVHTNSGVGNRFGSLLVDGGTSHGVAVTGVGEALAAKVVYGAAQLMTSASDYRGYAAALRQSCASLQSSGVATSATCAAVEAAISAVAMDAVPVKITAERPATPAACPTGIDVRQFTDSFEGGPSAAWTVNRVTYPAGVPNWFWASEQPYAQYGWSARYSSDGEDNLWGDDSGSAWITSASLATQVPLRASSYLLFDHAWSFDSDATGHYDGGRVDLPGGSDLVDEMMLSAVNGYNGRLSSAYGTSNPFFFGDPNRVVNAFVGTSKGYETTRVDTGLLKRTYGYDSTGLGFVMGTDDAFADYGWYVDNVRMGYCDQAPPVASASTPQRATVTGPTFTWRATDDGDVDHFLVRTRAFSARSSPNPYGAPTSTTSTARSLPFAIGRTSCVSVTAVDRAGRLSPAAERCASNPVDDRALARSGSWTSQSASGAYRGTLSVSKKLGATLTYTGVRGKGLAVVTRNWHSGGMVAVYVGSKRVHVFSTYAATTRDKRITYVTTGPLNGATVRLVVWGVNGGVAIDGLAPTW